MIFHKSNYGMFAGRFIADRNGQVGTTVEEVLTLNWNEDLTREMALDFAVLNTEALADADTRLAEWREGAR